VNFSPSDEDLLRLRRDIADGRLVMPPAPHALAVQVTLADGSLFPATGELNFADLALQPATGTQQLRAQLRNPQHVLLPGSSYGCGCSVSSGRAPSSFRSGRCSRA